LLLLDSPTEMQFGIDNQYWKTGHKFKGVKLIPLGAHYIYFALKDEDYAAKIGFFILITTGKVIVKRWDIELQNFQDLPEIDATGYIEGVKNMDFDKNLGAYPLDRYSNWKELSNNVTDKVLNRLEPVGALMISTQKEYDFEDKALKEVEEEKNEDEDDYERQDNDKLDAELKELHKEFGMVDLEEEEKKNDDKELDKTKKVEEKLEKFREPYGTVFYTDIPNRKIIQGLKGEDLTKINFDKSIILSELLSREYNNDYKLLLGELQFCFVTFVLGEILESLEQWKKLIILLCSCEDAIKRMKDLYLDFIVVFYAQIRQLPHDFFIDAITSNNFLRQTLQNFFELTNDASVSKKIRARSMKLKDMIQKNFQLEFSSQKERMEEMVFGYNENDEDMPVIVSENEQFISI